VLKVELHCHTDIDLSDRILYSTRALVDRAAELGFQAIAVTPHDAYFDPAPDARYASDRGITLIAGIECTVQGKHVLLLNFPRQCERVRTFNDIADLKAAHPSGLVVVPHAFYPNPSAIRRKLMDRHAHLVDAVEVNAMYTRFIDFNRRAIAWARARSKPLVGNSDLHVLDGLGTTYSVVHAEPTADAICDAIRLGQVKVRTTPLSHRDAAWTFARMLTGGALGRLRRLVR
jgi:predicted metal-dependent phosphoesterase TrpH